MKKRWIYALLLAMGLSVFTGCGKIRLGEVHVDELHIDNIQVGENQVGENQVEENQAEKYPVQTNKTPVFFSTATPLKDLNLEEYVKLGEYKGLRVNVPEVVPPDDEEVEITTKNIYFGNLSKWGEVKDRPVALQDIINIDFVGKKDGVAFDGGTAEDYLLWIGSGQFIDGFEDGLIGVNPGETVDLPLRFPDWYGNEELAGQEVVFTVTVNYITEMQDESVAELGIADVNNIEQLRGYVRDGILYQAQEEYYNTIQSSVLDLLVEGCEFTALPEDRVQSNSEIYANWLDQMAASYGMDGATYLSMYGADYDTVLKEQAAQQTRVQLAIQAVANAENLNISDEDLERRLLQNALLTGVSVDDLLVNGLTKEDYRESYVHEDVLNFLVENMVNIAAE